MIKEIIKKAKYLFYNFRGFLEAAFGLLVIIIIFCYIIFIIYIIGKTYYRIENINNYIEKEKRILSSGRYPYPQTNSFYWTSSEGISFRHGNEELLFIDPNRFYVNPNMPLDETAKAFINITNQIIENNRKQDWKGGGYME